ncbi:hypothetical protein [Thalassobaculum sp.]|uniref:hypothetical protein n=1 Tax=Thalassobaculum sp. TaxID=2022740 RepID=UPI0032EFF525
MSHTTLSRDAEYGASDETEVATPEHPAPKLRHCLRCQVEFHSQWSGERVCSRCKGTAAWRQGSPAEGR